MATTVHRFCGLLCWLTAGALSAQGPAAGDRSFFPPSIVPGATALVKSIGDAAESLLRWHTPANAASWEQRRPRVEKALLTTLGLDPLPERTPLNPRLLARTDRGEFSVETVVFESRPAFPITANLYRPRSGGQTPRPAVLVPIGHYLEEGKTASEVQALCMGLAGQGFVVLTYDAIGQGERMIPGNVHHEAGYALLPLGQTIAGWMVWDSMRALDYLESLPDVDSSRIGITGNSGGGLNSLLTAALDRRVRTAAVAGFTLEFNHWIKYGGAHCACTHLPGIFRSMEWFEIASLIAPRSLLLMQGEQDEIFPIAGARRAASHTRATFELLGAAANFRFDEIAGEPHAYSRPFRERAYGWLAAQLVRRGDGTAIEEPPLRLFPEQQPPLLCASDPRIAHQRAVVDVAREAAAKRIAALGPAPAAGVGAWLHGLIGPGGDPPGFLAPRSTSVSRADGMLLEEIGFLSEDGEYVPGTLRKPDGERGPLPVVIVAHQGGRVAFWEEPISKQLAAAGWAVLAVDLRGRGETLGRFNRDRDFNYRLISSQILSGRPLPGLRAFDLLRTVDYVATRPDLSMKRIVLAGFGDDALPALMAAAVDKRVEGVAVADGFQSFVSQMRTMQVPAGNRRELRRVWNSAQIRGRFDAGGYEVDFGSVIPSALANADIADIVATIAPRRVLFRQARDAGDAGDTAERMRRAARSPDSGFDFRPALRFDAAEFLKWLRDRKDTAISATRNTRP
ncbi:alpha/beta hydrolase [Paludibaculum fermentans]|uniref:Acetylxylan esterase n=1 Tax=Paludibaculum fermentans TaxID=1473598 RepID=A0A7S7NYG2_PALFE|nr:dienelactone hydrolase family protein [Paludibaculum fermentans]QOY91529.1 acetylxylan esterase [Paludibaculum fermentans]